MRFTILTQYFPPEVGAPQVRLREIALELQRQGHEVTVVTAMPNYPVGKVFPEYRWRVLSRETVCGLPVIRSWIYPATGRNILRRLLNYFSFTISSFFGCWLAPRPDLLLVESPPLFLGITAYLISRLRRIPYIFNVSDLWPDSAKELGIIENQTLLSVTAKLERFLYRKAWKISGQTLGILDRIEVKGIPRSHLVFLPNGVNLEAFKRVPVNGEVNKWVNPGQIPFVYAGTHGFAQGLDVIIEAAKILREHEQLVFLFIGEGPDKKRLQQLAGQYRLQNVRFIPAQPVEKMAAFFSCSRASIVPLKKMDLFKGARPSKIFPSLACQTPIIYCGEGEAADLIREENCGRVVPPEFPERLAEAVLDLARDTCLADRMGENGRAFVEMHYTWSKIVHEWLMGLGVS